MDFNEYQTEANKTAIYAGRGNVAGLMYAALGLAGEAGEVADRVKKVWRDDVSPFSDPEVFDGLRKELGDVLWYLSQVAEEIAVPLDYIAGENVQKLRSRQERGVLGGSGDER